MSSENESFSYTFILRRRNLNKGAFSYIYRGCSVKVVCKKYKRINGKLYGPYYYENKRVGKKVITTYIGKSDPSKKQFNWVIPISILAIIFLAFSIASFNLSNFSPTGKAIDGGDAASDSSSESSSSDISSALIESTESNSNAGGLQTSSSETPQQPQKELPAEPALVNPAETPAESIPSETPDETMLLGPAVQSEQPQIIETANESVPAAEINQSEVSNESIFPSIIQPQTRQT